MRRRHPGALSALIALGAAVVVGGCGAKTGLLIPDADLRADASFDAGMDASDAFVPDAICPEMPIPLSRPEVEVMLVLDASGSMAATWDGLPAGAGLPSRWEILESSLGSALPPIESRLLLGANVFPDGAGCEVERGLEVTPGYGASSSILGLFRSRIPEGATPTAEAIRITATQLSPARPDLQRVIVVMTDGGPNCNDDTGVPSSECICTSSREVCLTYPEPWAQQSCLDATRTIEVVSSTYRDRGVPVVVIGIDDPSRADLSDFLDEMAIAGGAARPAGSARRFYIAREPEDLEAAFRDITELLSTCVMTAQRTPPEGAAVEVRIAGRLVPQDAAHVDGWDWTDRSAGTLAFFGPSCAELSDLERPVTMRLLCASD